jgi:hypothetical protein
MQKLTGKKHPITGANFDFEKEVPPGMTKSDWEKFPRKKEYWANYLWQQEQGR